MHSHRADALPQDGVHYHFTAKPQMEKEIADGQFLEHAHVHGNIYGTSVAAVREVAANGKCCILDIDVQGARQVRDRCDGSSALPIGIPSVTHRSRRGGVMMQTQRRVQRSRLQQARSCGGQPARLDKCSATHCLELHAAYVSIAAT